MRTPVFHLQDILDAFRRKKVLLKEELLRAAGCSAMTAWRLLHQHGYFTSYNDNARYYTVVGVPRFDEHGLWAYRNARFSKWGSLTKTIRGLVQESAAGLSAGQLHQLLKVENVKPVLTRLIDRGFLTRQRIQGRFVYFPLEQSVRAKQQNQRTKQAEKAQAERSLPPLDHIIALLVELIRHPQDSSRQWTRRLARQRIHMSSSEVHAVLKHYGIDVKKGLLNS